MAAGRTFKRAAIQGIWVAPARLELALREERDFKSPVSAVPPRGRWGAPLAQLEATVLRHWNGVPKTALS